MIAVTGRDRDGRGRDGSASAAGPVRSTRWVVAAPLTLVLSGCAGTAPATLAAPTDGPLAVHTAPPAGGDAALLDGVLRYDGTCLTVVTGSDERYLPVFAHARATWDGEALTHEGRTTAPGQPITLEGGGGTSTAVADYVPEGCDVDLVFVVAANP